MSIQIHLDLRPQDFEFRGYEVMLSGRRVGLGVSAQNKDRKSGFNLTMARLLCCFLMQAGKTLSSHNTSLISVQQDWGEPVKC